MGERERDDEQPRSGNGWLRLRLRLSLTLVTHRQLALSHHRASILRFITYTPLPRSYPAFVLPSTRAWTHSPAHYALRTPRVATCGLHSETIPICDK